MRMTDTRIERLHHASRLPEIVVAARIPKVLTAAMRLASSGRGNAATAALPPPAAPAPRPPPPPPAPHHARGAPPPRSDARELRESPCRRGRVALERGRNVLRP